MNDVQTNDRGEFTDASGKLYHQVATKQPPQNIGDYAVHEGPWLNCDGCNPVVVVQLPEEISGDGPSSQLDLLLLRSAYSGAKRKADAAAEEAKTLQSKLKAALSEASGGATRSSLHVPGFKPLNLTYVESWRLDTPALKAAHPAVYVEFAKRSGSWRLEESRGK